MTLGLVTPQPLVFSWTFFSLVRSFCTFYWTVAPKGKSGPHIDLFISTLPSCLVNTSISMDDQSPTFHSFGPAGVTCNILYTSIAVPFGNHIIRVALLDAVRDVNHTSCLLFDYAVNDMNSSVASATSSTQFFPIDSLDLSQKL